MSHGLFQLHRLWRTVARDLRLRPRVLGCRWDQCGFEGSLGRSPAKRQPDRSWSRRATSLPKRFRSEQSRRSQAPTPNPGYPSARKGPKGEKIPWTYGIAGCVTPLCRLCAESPTPKEAIQRHVTQRQIAERRLSAANPPTNDPQPQSWPENVSHDLGVPPRYPSRNHFVRSTDDPCVQCSGLRAPSRSSPTAAAAASPSSMSPTSSTPRS